MIYWYFGALVVLCVLFQMPIVLALASMVVLPVYVLAASNTVLLYSILLLPFFIWPRALFRWPPLAVLALIPAVAVAFGVPALSQWRCDAFVANVTRDDFDRPATLKNARALTIFGSRLSDPACDDLCERLLYNGEADKIVMARWSGNPSDNIEDAIAYRVVRDPPCKITPATPGPHSLGAKARMDSGDCIAPEVTANAETVDATIGQWPIYLSSPSWNEPRETIDRFAFDLNSIERLTLSAGGPRTGQPLVRKTLVSTATVAMPFHFTIGGTWFALTIQIARTGGTYTGNSVENLLREKLGMRVEGLVKAR